MYNQVFLEELIQNKIEEDLNLDYKASGSLERTDRKMNEISKDVSAMANSNGGKIIYGITEKDHLPEKIDPIDRDKFSKEWLEQIIQGRIRPKVDGIRIYPVEIDSNSKNVVYVVDIPQSTTAHQASDKKYYRRHNFNSIPMFDYEIRDIFNRAKTPKIDLNFEIWYYKKIRNGSSENNPFTPSSEQKIEHFYLLKVFAKNNGKVLSEYINCYIQVPELIFEENFEVLSKNDYKEYLLDNKFRDVVNIKMNFPHTSKELGPARFEPMLPNSQLLLDSNFPRLHKFYRDYNELLIRWQVYADNAEPVSGETKIEDIPFKRKY